MQPTLSMTSLIRVPKLLTALPWLPPLMVLALVLSLHLDVPYHDQWDLLPLLDAYYQGTLHWQALLQPHNGHILLLPQAVMLLLAILTHWNTLAEVLFGFLCMLGNWQLLQKLAASLLGKPLSLAEKTLLSLLVFSLTQAQNWLWGWQLQIPLALLFALAGFSALLYLRSDWLALLTAIACGAAANLSFAGSLPFWIAALPLLWQRRPLLVLPWLLASSSCLLGYAYAIGVLPAASGVSNRLDAAEIVHHSRNTFALLGNLFAHYHYVVAAICGCAGIVIICIRFSGLSARGKALSASLLLFSVGGGALVTLSRAMLGDEQMLAGRYSTLTLPFWTAAAMLFADRLHSASNGGWKLCGAFLLASLLASDIQGLQDFAQLHRRLQRGATALAQIETPQGKQQLPVINPRINQQQALQEVQLLQDYCLSFYRHATVCAQASTR